MPARSLTSMPTLALAAVLVITGCDRPAMPTAPSAVHLATSQVRPFRLTVEGNANPDFSQGPCNVVNTEAGTGKALHLGKVTWTSSEVANFCVDPSNPGKAAVTGTMVVTAANGDQLTISYQSTVQGDFAAGTLTVTGTWTITGGTGRFSDASGSGTLTAAGSLAPPFDIAGEFVGGITY